MGTSVVVLLLPICARLALALHSIRPRVAFVGLKEIFVLPCRSPYVVDTLSSLSTGKRICDLYVAKTGKAAPPGCETFPQTDAEVGPNPFGRFKETNFTSLIAKLAMEQRQQKHVGLKRASSERKSTVLAEPALAHASIKAVDTKHKWKELPTKTRLPAKIKSVVSFADSFFGRKETQNIGTEMALHFV